MEPLSCLIVSRSLRGWVGRQQAHLSSGPLGFAEGSSAAFLFLRSTPPQATSLFLPGKFHGWRSLLSYHPWGCKESHTTSNFTSLRDLLECSPSDSSVRGIPYARILQWAAISFSGGFSQPRDQTHVSSISCTGR